MKRGEWANRGTNNGKFFYKGAAIYSKSGDTATYVSSNIDIDQTFDDNEGDSTFEVGDTLSLLGSSTTAVFRGTMIINGTPFIVIETSSDYYLCGPTNLSAADYPATFSLSGDVDTSVFAVCFGAGTMIATPDGGCPVDALEIGDQILTADGNAVRVKWIGRQTLHKVFTPRERFVPVRVRAGALGDGLPVRDLVLTADHALLIDGLLINASALVNGSSISYERYESLPEQVTYYHIETEAHDVVLAEGVPAETFVDYITRRKFDNYAEYQALYGDEASILERDIPRVSAARLLPPGIRQRLAA